MKIFYFFFIFAGQARALNPAAFDEFVTKIEQMTIDFRDFVETLYLKKPCDLATFTQCLRGSYDECESALPNPTCPVGDWGYQDRSASVVRFAPGVDPSDPKVVEDVCIGRYIDEYLNNAYEENKEFFDQIGLHPRAMYVGSATGVFRIYPGFPSIECGAYDCRLRSWYISGGSGPKNVILVLDISGSMEGARLSLMKEAAIRVIETLTDSDRVAIVSFDTTAHVIADEDMYLYKATNASKALLIDAINSLEAKGDTNIYDALDKTFDVLDDSVEKERAVGCNSAILFFTDGEMTHPENITQAEVIELVTNRTNVTSSKIGKPIAFFAYSVSESEEVHSLPKQMVCPLELGTWARIESDQKIVQALSSYYQLFALNLGLGPNANFVAWSDTYKFANTNEPGTTASAPFFDRSTSPPLFKGVVGIDVLLSILARVLGAKLEEVIAELAARSVAKCPTYESTTCLRDSYAVAAGGEESRCTPDVCTDDDLVTTVSKPCFDSSKYPTDLFVNTVMKGRSYEERTRCEKEPKFISSPGAIAAIAIAVLVVVILLWMLCRWRKSQQAKKTRAVAGPRKVVGGAIELPDRMKSSAPLENPSQ